MQISRIFNLNNSPCFGGIKSPYMDETGNYIIPIKTCPSADDINAAIKATTKIDKTKKDMEGCNGKAFFFGEDLIVKTYKAGNKKDSSIPEREIKMLDKMYDLGIHFPNSQDGCYAFITPSEEYYLVSTKVEGENPNPSAMNLTKENLFSLINIICDMDKGQYEPSQKTFYRFMNYDFNGKNIKVTPKKAGVYDFEYSQIENIANKIQERIYGGINGVNCHQSDTSFLSSSLRSFELWTLHNYLLKSPNADKTFNDYLSVKRKYHYEMSLYYREIAQDCYFSEILENIARKEKAHASLLRTDENGKISKDIKKAEAIKIQMASFLHQRTPFCATGIVNPEQLKQYVTDSIDFFSKQLNIAKENNDKNRIIYYEDCMELFSSWKMVIPEIEYLIKNDISYFMHKITKERMKTLNDVLTLE